MKTATNIVINIFQSICGFLFQIIINGVRQELLDCDYECFGKSSLTPLFYMIIKIVRPPLTVGQRDSVDMSVTGIDDYTVLFQFSDDT